MKSSVKLLVIWSLRWWTSSLHIMHICSHFCSHCGLFESDHCFCVNNSCSFFTDARKKYQSFTLEAHSIWKYAIEKLTLCLGHCETTWLEKHKSCKDPGAGALSLSFKLLPRFLSWTCCYPACWVCIWFCPLALHQFCTLEQVFKSSQLLSQPTYSPWKTENT